MRPAGHQFDTPALDYEATSSASFMRDDGKVLSLQNQRTQTEWTYETQAPLTSKPKKQRESAASVRTAKPDSQERIVTEVTQEEEWAMELISQESFWDSAFSEPADAREAEDFGDSSLFRAVIEEMSASGELDEDPAVPLTFPLQSGARRKLGVLLKNNFQKYKNVILWLVKKHKYLLNTKAETSTYTFHLRKSFPGGEELEAEAAKEPHDKKTLEIDTEWTKNQVQVHEGDAKLLLHAGKSIFQVLFPDGSGQIHYPSGRLAMLVLSPQERKVTYVVLDDSEEACVRALVTNAGHATFYDENRDIWLSLSPRLGYYFAKGKPQKAWNWWDPSRHVHAPPLRSISLTVNQHIEVHVRSQAELVFRFTHPAKHVCFNLGTKYKVIVPELLSAMRETPVLDGDLGAAAREIRVLLGEMRRILKLLTALDLESFLGAAQSSLENHMRGRTTFISPWPRAAAPGPRVSPASAERPEPSGAPRTPLSP